MNSTMTLLAITIPSALEIYNAIIEIVNGYEDSQLETASMIQLETASSCGI